MAKQPKAKTGTKTRNDARKNGKANKTSPGRVHKKSPIDPILLVCMGKGIYAKPKPKS